MSGHDSHAITIVTVAFKKLALWPRSLEALRDHLDMQAYCTSGLAYRSRSQQHSLGLYCRTRTFSKKKSSLGHIYCFIPDILVPGIIQPGSHLLFLLLHLVGTDLYQVWWTCPELAPCISQVNMSGHGSHARVFVNVDIRRVASLHRSLGQLHGHLDMQAECTSSLAYRSRSQQPSLGSYCRTRTSSKKKSSQGHMYCFLSLYLVGVLFYTMYQVWLECPESHVYCTWKRQGHDSYAMAIVNVGFKRAPSLPRYLKPFHGYLEVQA